MSTLKIPTLDFPALAKNATPKKSFFYGLLPAEVWPVLTILAASAAIAAGAWLWTGAVATFVSVFPTALATFAGLTALTFVNFWVGREIIHFKNSARDIPGKLAKFGDDNPVNLHKMVEQLRYQIFIYLKTQPEYKHIYTKKMKFSEMPKVRLNTISDHHFKIITVKGRNPSHGALYISAGTTSNDGGMADDHRRLAAIILPELIKIYTNRGVGSFLTTSVSDLFATLDVLGQDNIFYQALGILASPLKFFFLMQLAMERSYDYEAATHAFNMGWGTRLFNAWDKVVNSSQKTFPLDSEIAALKAKQLKKKKEKHSYKGFMVDGFMKDTYVSKQFLKLVKWIDARELITDDKSGYRFFTAIDICTREFGFWVEELFKSVPRITNKKNHYRDLFEEEAQTLKEKTKTPKDKKKTQKNKNKTKDKKDEIITFKNCTKENFQIVADRELEKYRKQYKNIPSQYRYPSIGPDANGRTKPELRSEFKELKAKLKEKNKEIKSLRKDVDALKVSVKAFLPKHTSTAARKRPAFTTAPRPANPGKGRSAARAA